MLEGKITKLTYKLKQLEGVCLEMKAKLEVQDGKSEELSLANKMIWNFSICLALLFTAYLIHENMESFVAKMFDAGTVAGNITLANKMIWNFSICLALLFTAYLIHENMESFVAKMFDAGTVAGNIILANKMIRILSICLALLFTAYHTHQNMECFKKEIVLAFLTLPYILTYLVTYLTLLDSYLVVPQVLFMMLPAYRSFENKSDKHNNRFT